MELSFRVPPLAGQMQRQKIMKHFVEKAGTVKRWCAEEKTRGPLVDPAGNPGV